MAADTAASTRGIGREGDVVFASRAVEAVVDAIGVEQPDEVAAEFGDW